MAKGMTALLRPIVRPLMFALAGGLVCAIPASLAAPLAAQAAGQSSGQSASSTAQLDRAITALRAITTMKADFTQTDRNGQAVRGELTLRNPGRIRFEYGDDTNMLVVSDGNSLTLIDYDVQQVERWPIKNSPLGALLDPSRDVRRYGTLVPSSNRNVIAIEVSDPARPEFGQIRLIFINRAGAPGGMELASWVALDSQNTRTTIRLTNHRYGMAVPDSTFRFRDPRRTTRRPG